ncbi:glycosyltransferase family 39 protein [Candidatus Bathyarchaeota archaeon]|nr:glycosyltransferase family 39 protein [Candidatus Bathyarchaeota archaeon]
MKNLGVLSALLVVATVARLSTPIELTLDNTNADSDVYLAMAMMVNRGYKLYNQVFYGHPPLMIWILSYAFKVFGTSALIGGLVGVVLSLIGISGIYFTAKRLGGFGAGILSGILLSFSPLYLQVSRSASNEILLCALSPWMLYSFLLYLESRSYRWLILSGLLSGFCFLSKFYAVFLFLSVCLCFIYKRRLREMVYYLILTAIPMLSLLTFDIAAVWKDIFLFPLYRPVTSLNLRLERLTDFLRADLGLISLGIGGAFFQLKSRKNEKTSLIVLWLFLTFTGLIAQTTLFKHHLVHTLLPLAICASFLIKEAHVIQPKEVMAFSLMLMLFSLPTLIVYDPVAVTSEFPALVDARFEVAQLVQNMTTVNDFIISGDLMIPVIANRMVPPNLIDISDTRHEAKFILSRNLIEDCIKYDVKIVIVSSRLLSFGKFIEFVRKHYINVGTIRVSGYPQAYAYAIYIKR